MKAKGDELKKGRVNEYDLLRVIATILVVIGHSCYLVMGGVHYEVPADSSWVYDSNLFRIIRFLSGWVYGFHMPLFFLLSGAVYRLKEEDGLKRLACNKLKRLIIPYYLCGLLFMLPVKLMTGYYNADNYNEAVVKFLVGKGDGHLWFLPALFWCFIIFWCLHRLVGKRNIYPVLVLAALIQYFHGQLPFDFFLFKRGMGYLFWFVLGYWFDGVRKKLSEYSYYEYGVCKFLFLLEIMILDIKIDFLNDFFVIIICSYAVYLLCIILVKKYEELCERWGCRLFLRHSMHIYLFHDPLEYAVLLAAFSYGWLSSRLGCLAYMGMRIIGVIILSVVMGYIVDKLKSKLLKIS